MEKEQIEHIVNMCNELYRLPDSPDGSSHACGGHLHIVLDDQNIENDHVEFCIESAKQDRCKPCEIIGKEILQMSVLERARLVRGRYGKYIF